jgi:hypothetical protein
MFRRVAALSSVQHARLRVLPAQDFAFARGLHMAALMQPEMVRASAVYPIVFVEEPGADSFMPVALFGLEQGANVFVDASGRWQASYVPAVVRGYPFSLVRTGRGDRHALCIDVDSDCVGESAGEPLFSDSGQPSPALEEARSYFARLRQMQVLTDAYADALKQANLLTPFSVRAKRGDRTVDLEGCYVVNETRLDALSDQGLLALRHRGWLASTYAHVASLHQIERLS